MAFDFEFRTLGDQRDLNNLLDFLRINHLNYPGYLGWIERAEAELQMGYKTAVVVHSLGRIAGDIIWQPHKELPRFREIKNLRVHPSVQNRFISKFLLRQAEVEPGDFDSLILDYREDHPDIIPLSRTLTSMGYQTIASAALYEPKIRDIVAVKNPKLAA